MIVFYEYLPQNQVCYNVITHKDILALKTRYELSIVSILQNIAQIITALCIGMWPVSGWLPCR